MSTISVLSPYCPSCHKIRFTDMLARAKPVKACQCKAGRAAIQKWLPDQQEAMSNMTSPEDAIMEDPEIQPDSILKEHVSD